jgi:hypothetical protein
MLDIVQRVVAYPVKIGGVSHSGWLPPGASIPLPTPVHEVALDLEIQFDGSGYLLCYSTADGSVRGDTWHQLLEDAVTEAEKAFGIPACVWQPQEVGS